MIHSFARAWPVAVSFVLVACSGGEAGRSGERPDLDGERPGKGTGDPESPFGVDPGRGAGPQEVGGFDAGRPGTGDPPPRDASDTGPSQGSARARTIAAGYNHTCAIDPTGLVVCWGKGNANRPDLPVTRAKPPAGLTATHVAATHTYNCVLSEVAGQAALRPSCFGETRFGLDAVPAGLDPVQITAGDVQPCVLNRDGSVRCWGQADAPAPPANLVAKELFGGGVITCATRLDDTFVCWGYNVPALPAALKVKQVASGNNALDAANLQRVTTHVCSVDLNGDVACWGDGTRGQTSVPAGLKAKQIALGNGRSCAVTLDDSVVCWGRPLGPDDLPMPPNLKARYLTTNQDHVCAVTFGDTPVCWGRNGEGRATPPAGLVVKRP